MRYMPIKNKKANYLTFALLIGGLILFYLSSFIKPPFLFQIIAIAMFTLSIQIMQRYVLSDFVYIIDDKDSGEAILNVVRAQGNRKTTVCSAELSKCTILSENESADRKITNSFDYKQNLFAGSYITILYTDGEDCSKIKIEADENFSAELKKRIF